MVQMKAWLRFVFSTKFSFCSVVQCNKCYPASIGRNKKSGPQGAAFKIIHLMLLIEPIQIHHLTPYGHEIFHKLFLCIITGIYFGYGTQF